MYTPLQEAAAGAPTKRRVLIVDDHRFFAGCLRTLLDAESDLVVCDVTNRIDELPARIQRLQPDLLVIDLALGDENGLAVGQRLRSQGVRTPILFMSTMRTLSEGQLATVRHAAFAAKSRSPAQFLAVLRRVLQRQETAQPAAEPRLGFEPIAAAV